MSEYLSKGEGYQDPTLDCLYRVIATMGGTATPEAVAPSSSAPEEIPAEPLKGTWPEGQSSVKDMPRLPALLNQPERGENTVSYWTTDEAPAEGGQVPETISEAEALAELDRFLADAIRTLEPSERQRTLLRKARAIKENLCFIGGSEFAEGTAGIAALWQTRLEADPNLDIIVPHQLGSRKEESPYKKSQELVYEAVMSHFPPGHPLRERIHGGDLVEPASGRHGLVVLLDDWSKSGMQASALYEDIQNSPSNLTMEAHLLAASETQLEDGLRVRTPEGDVRMPAKAYFKAGSGTLSGHERPLVTGAHSTVDYDFGYELGDLQWHCAEKFGVELKMPALGNVARPPR